MNLSAANIEICRQLAKGSRIRTQIMSKKLILVIPEPAYYGYIMDVKDPVFSIEKTTSIDKKNQIINLSILDQKNEITPTPYLRILTEKHNETARLFKSSEGNVWVNTKYLKHINIHQCKFYQDRTKRNSLILVVENEKTPVMCVLPLRIFDEQEPCFEELETEIGGTEYATHPSDS
jgi:hypothetical protein